MAVSSPEAESLGAGTRAARRSARGGALNLAGAAVSAVAQLVAVVMVTRGSGQEVAGGLFAAVSVLLIGAAVAQLGTDVSLVRHLAACRVQCRRQDAVSVVRWSIVGVTGTGLLLTAGLAASGSWLAALLGGSDPTAITVLVLAVPVLSLHELCLAVTRGTGSMRPTVALERVARPLLQVALVGLVHLRWPSDPTMLAAAWVLPWVIVLPLSAAAAFRAVRLVPDGGPPVPSTAHAAFWKFTATRAGARACQVALQRLDIILVAALVGASAAAVYTAATRFLVLGQLVATAVQQAAQPFFAGLHSAGDTASQQDLLRRTTVWSVALVWPAYLVMALGATPLIALFGDGYDRGGPSLVVLAVAMLAATAAGPVDVVLQMSGRGGTSLLITVAALVVDVVGCLLLVPRLDIVGAALAWAAAILVRNVATVWAVRRVPGVTAGSADLLRVVCQALLLLAAPTAAAVLLAPSLVWSAGIVVIAGVVYLAVLWRDRRRNGLDLVWPR